MGSSFPRGSRPPAFSRCGSTRSRMIGLRLPLLRRTCSARRGVHGARAGAQRSGRLARRKPKRIGVPQVRVDRSHDNARFDGDEVDADERHADPGIDDDALIEDAVEDIDEARAAWTAFNDRHLLTPFCLELSLELRDARLESRDIPGADPVSLALATKRRVVPPPVESDLLGLVDRAHQESDADREQLDVRERHADVARDHEALVQDAVEEIDERRGLLLPGGHAAHAHGAAAIRSWMSSWSSPNCSAISPTFCSSLMSATPTRSTSSSVKVSLSIRRIAWRSST